MTIVEHLARVRRLFLDDALQLATAIIENCDAFLTNDPMLKRVVEVNVLILDAVEAE